MWREANHLENLPDCSGQGIVPGSTTEFSHVGGALLCICVQQLHLFVSFPLQLSVCKELQLPTNEYGYTADLVDITSAAPLETAGVQSVSVLAVAAEGTAHWWPSLAQEGKYAETEVDLGDLCSYVVAVTVSVFT